MFISIFAFSVFFPAVTAAAQNLGREAPGATSALLGCTQFLIAAAQTMLPQPAPEVRRQHSRTSADTTIKVDPISMLGEAGQA